MKNILRCLALLLLLSIFAACGGGGSGGGDTTTPPPTVYTKMTIKVELTGTLPSATTITGAGFTLTLPANVTPAVSGSDVAASVVTLSDTFAGGTQAPAVYTPATSATKGTLQVIPVNAVPAGITKVGEIATITLQLANGAAPTLADMGSLSSVTVIDVLYNQISGMGAKISSVTLLQ